jgi:hypothetical protein
MDMCSLVKPVRLTKDPKDQGQDLGMKQINSQTFCNKKEHERKEVLFLLYLFFLLVS